MELLSCLMIVERYSWYTVNQPHLGCIDFIFLWMLSMPQERPPQLPKHLHFYVMGRPQALWRKICLPYLVTGCHLTDVGRSGNHSLKDSTVSQNKTMSSHRLHGLRRRPRHWPVSATPAKKGSPKSVTFFVVSQRTRGGTISIWIFRDSRHEIWRPPNKNRTASGSSPQRAGTLVVSRALDELIAHTDPAQLRGFNDYFLERYGWHDQWVAGKGPMLRLKYRDIRPTSALLAMGHSSLVVRLKVAKSPSAYRSTLCCLVFSS